MKFDALLAVHALIRRDLDTVDQLAAAILDGLPAQGLQKELSTLSDRSLLWQFQISCLRYCREVHLHHHAEDVALFEELQQTNPTIRPIIDRLKDDHRAQVRAMWLQHSPLTLAGIADRSRLLPKPPKLIAPDASGAFLSRLIDEWASELRISSALMSARPRRSSLPQRRQSALRA